MMIAALIAVSAIGFGSLYLIQDVHNPNDSKSLQNNDFSALAQMQNLKVVPDAALIFTSDAAAIQQVDVDPFVMEFVHYPKTVTAGKSTTMTVNLFYKENMEWLWHTDYSIKIKKQGTEKELTRMPNIHGHGGMAQIAYVFPTSGTYEIEVVAGQQVGSPNYKGPKAVETAIFTIDVESPTYIIHDARDTSSKAVKEFDVLVTSWAFNPNAIAVNEGDLVRLNFNTAIDEIGLYNGHGFGIDGYNVDTFLVKGSNHTVEFVADKPGTFTFRCTSFCAPLEAGENMHYSMIGTFIVE